MPRLQGLPQLDFGAERGEVPILGETELEVRREPLRLESKACLVQLRHDIGKILFDEMRQHEPVVQFGAPSGQALGRVWRAPEAGQQRPQQQLLRQAHLRVRRHFESPQLQQALAPGSGVGRVELVDAKLRPMGIPGHIHEQIAQHPIDQPRRRGLRRRRELLEGDLQLVQRIVARLVHTRRLRGGTEKQAGKQVGQRGMVVPVGHQAAQQIRTPQERRVPGRGAAQDEVITAAGAGMAAIEHELLARQACLPCGLV